MRTTRSIPISAFADEEARLNALADFMKENRCRVIHMLVKSACRKYGIEPLKQAVASVKPKEQPKDCSTCQHLDTVFFDCCHPEGGGAVDYKPAAVNCLRKDHAWWEPIKSPEVKPKEGRK